MNRRKIMLGAAAMTAVTPLQSQPDVFCREIAKVIALVKAIRIGQTRSSLNQDWTQDGGIQVAYATRYKLRRCESIKIDVSFSKKDGDPLNDPDAVVEKVSLHYLRFRTFD